MGKHEPIGIFKRMLSEEMKMSCAAGEFVHSIGNRIVDKTVSIDSLCDQGGKLLQELGSILRVNDINGHPCPVLESVGFNPSDYNRSELMELAGWILDSGKTFDECVKSMEFK